MANDRSGTNEEIPEADLLEQRAETAYDDGDDTEGVVDLVSSSDTVADPADRQEQLTAVGEDDEDYPHA